MNKLLEPAVLKNEYLPQTISAISNDTNLLNNGDFLRILIIFLTKYLTLLIIFIILVNISNY